VAFFFKQWGGRTPKAVKVGGRWRYVYRAVDQYGQVIDVLVSAGRDQDAARRFFRRALGSTQVIPTEVVTDRAAVYPAVVDELLPEAWHRTDRYANNRAAGSARPWEPRRGLVSSRGAVRSNRRLSREVRPAAFYATVDAADLGDRA
jgi:transposase-like protein